MTEAPAPKTSRLAALRSALEQGSMRHGQRMINSMHPAEIASLIESLPPAKREMRFCWNCRTTGRESKSRARQTRA